MEFLFDLLPLLAIYVLVRVFSRKRTPTPPTETLDINADASTAPMSFEQLLQALAAGQAEAERVASGEPTQPAAEAAPSTSAPTGSDPTSRPRKAKKASAPPPPATASPARPVTDGARFYDDETVFDRGTPAHAHDDHAGIDSQGFATANFVEHGLRSHAPLDAPIGPPPRPVSGIAARLRNPATAREAFEIQMLLERRGRGASEPRRPGASPRRPTR